MCGTCAEVPSNKIFASLCIFSFQVSHLYNWKHLPEQPDTLWDDTTRRRETIWKNGKVGKECAWFPAGVSASGLYCDVKLQRKFIKLTFCSLFPFWPTFHSLFYCWNFNAELRFVSLFKAGDDAWTLSCKSLPKWLLLLSLSLLFCKEPEFLMKLSSVVDADEPLGPGLLLSGSKPLSDEKGANVQYFLHKANNGLRFILIWRCIVLAFADPFQVHKNVCVLSLLRGFNSLKQIVKACAEQKVPFWIFFLKA